MHKNIHPNIEERFFFTEWAKWMHMTWIIKVLLYGSDYSKEPDPQTQNGALRVEFLDSWRRKNWLQKAFFRSILCMDIPIPYYPARRGKITEGRTLVCRRDPGTRLCIARIFTLYIHSYFFYKNKPFIIYIKENKKNICVCIVWLKI